MPADTCPCCSALPYAQCCQPLHLGGRAISPEALMRSRFSAHALGLLPYIVHSWSAEGRAALDQSELARWLANARFGRLIVRAAEADWVEFECWYLQDGQLQHLHDRSFFIQQDGHWRYHESKAPRLPATRIGRNDPCPCGSGKKSKQCPH